MATYKFSAPPTLLTSGATTTFPASGTSAFTTSDIFVFDSETLSAGGAAAAADLAATATTISGTTTTTITIGSKVFIFSGFAQEKISSSNFTFADGSKLIIGDGTSSTSLDASANTLIGTGYGDYLDGRGGSDTVSYASALSAVAVDLTSAVAQNTGGAGTDKLLRIENIIGSAYNDTLKGVAAGSIIDGGLGIDALTGGAGNDTFIVTAGDTVTDASTADTDTVKSSADWALSANLENLTLLTGAFVGVGNATANLLTGNNSNNVLEGKGATGAPVDTLTGGDGNDTYIITDGDESIIETNSATTQIDTVISSGTVAALAANVENLRLIGAVSGTGNTLNNIIYAGTGSNATLDGGAGTDTLSYQFGATAGVVITLNATSAATIGSGSDASSGFENLTGSNYSDTLTGDTAANIITGGLGNDILNGGAAADTLDGGVGNDTYRVDTTTDKIIDTAGTDTVIASVDFSIATLTTIENLTANGAAAITLTGNSLANTLDSESNAFNDILVGGTGNDTYLVDNASDTVTEDANAGTDTVQTSVTYDLSASADNVENLTLAHITGSHITGTGNDLANIITASAFGDTLLGGGGIDKLVGGLEADSLNGGEGNDNMTGGAGDDNYVVDATGDTVVELASGGTDAVNASATYTLAANIEALTLTGSIAINGTGSAGDNTLTGNSGTNVLTGGLGADTIIGGAGKDTITLTETTSSADTVQFEATFALNNSDTITGFASGTDKIDLNAVTALLGVTAVTGSLTNVIDLVYFLEGQAAGSADSLAAAAAAITAAATWTSAAVTTNIIVVDNNSTAIYEWVDVATAGASASELKLMGTIGALSASGDYIFA
ncbi:MAG: calcium-binding protein [Nitrospirota bacterium]|nr:calcium-binding protein [Nitrospirota bacterium]